MSDQQKVVYLKVDTLQYWRLPNRDITQEDLDVFTPSELRELVHSAGYEKVQPIDLTKLNRAELEGQAVAAGLKAPFDRFKLKEDLIKAITDGEPPEEIAPPVNPPHVIEPGQQPGESATQTGQGE